MIADPHRRKRILQITLWLLVLALALFLRTRHLDTTHIRGDQSFTLSTAMRWVNGGAMPLAANKSSAGFVNPPMIEYLYAAALRVWPDVLSVSLLTMLSGVVALVATGWATYRVFGGRAAFWTTLVFAANPWSVLYSQVIWNQTMVPVFSSLTLACLLVYFAGEQRPVYLALSLVWAAFMTQVHPGTSTQLLAMAAIYASFWRRLRLWPLAAGVAIFVLLYVPFILYEHGVGWTDLEAIRELAGQAAPLSIASVLLSLDLMRVRGLGAVVCGHVLDGLATVLLGLSLVYALAEGTRAALRRHRDQRVAPRAAGLVTLLLWFVFPILLYLRSSRYLQIYYLIGQLPAHFVLIGACLDGTQSLIERAADRAPEPSPRRAIQIAAHALLPLPLLVLTIWQAVFNLRLQNERLENPGGETQVRHIRALAQASRDYLSEYRACDLVVVSEGHSVETSKLSLLRELTSPRRVLLTDGRSAIPIPAPCATYLDALPGSPASTWLTGAATSLPVAAVSLQDGPWRFYTLAPDARERLVERASSAQPLAVWTNGLALKGYTRGEIRPGAPLPLTLTWVVETSPPEITYHIGAYLLTPDSQVVAQFDGPGFDSVQWKSGQAIISWLDIPVPEGLAPGDYQIAMATYTWPWLERVDLISGGNTAFLERVTVAGP